ncbi:MAG: hypothetical protein U0L10_11320, partial [Lachnospiraceae bacterium]|nr:hypothetical protein [Lachnospiraceae bacterium]
KYCRRCELARKRIKDFSDTYGECRDREQKAKRLRTCRHGELLEKANAKNTADAASLLASG